MKQWYGFMLLLIGALALNGTGCAGRDRISVTGAGPSVEGRTLNSARMKQGGNFLVVPFSAGENVFATDELQGISLRLVRGVHEAMKGNTEFVLMTADSSGSPDMVMKGRVTRMSEKKRFPGIFTDKCARILAVDGEVLDKKTGEPLVRFSHVVRNEFPQESFGTMASRAGQDIGNFIMNGMKH